MINVLKRRRHVLLAAAAILLGIFFILGGSGLAALTLVNTNSATVQNGSALSVTVAGDEDPWKVFVTFKGIGGSPVTSALATCAMSAPAAGTHLDGRAMSQRSCSVVVPGLPAGAPNYARTLFQAAPRNDLGSTTEFWVGLCPSSSCSTGSVYAASLQTLSPGQSVEFGTIVTDDLRGRTVHVVARALGTTSSSWSVASDSRVWAESTAPGSTNPTIGTASFGGTLASGQDSTPIPFHGLKLGQNSLPVSVTGSGHVSIRFSYHQGRAPIVTGLNVTGASIAATAVDENAPQGDAITGWAWRVSRGGSVVEEKESTSATIAAPTTPGSYLVEARAKDALGVYGAWASRAFSIEEDGDAPKQGDFKSGVTAPSATPGDFFKRVAVGGIKIVNFLTGGGFNASPPSWLPQVVKDYVYGGET